MKMIDVLEVPHASGTKTIELLSGDLTQIPRKHAVDVLVVSAFPNDYLPTRTSLIGALDREGVSVAKLAEKPEANLTENFACWLSHPIDSLHAGLNFKRILCFEPRRKGRPPEVVGDIFQALAPFVFAKPHVRSIAMPIVASGDQNEPIGEMLSALVDAAFHWLKEGFPVKTIKLVVYERALVAEAKVRFVRQAERLTKLDGGHPDFSALPSEVSASSKTRSVTERKESVNDRVQSPPGSTNNYNYDVFISYSREDKAAAQHLYKCLVNAKLRVFIDQVQIETGAAWQQTIFDALGSCAVTAVLYSPAFLQSKMCKEEFNIAWIRRRESGREVIFPLLIKDTSLPIYMKLLNYLDCRISNKPRIKSAAAQLVASLQVRS